MTLALVLSAPGFAAEAHDCSPAPVQIQPPAQPSAQTLASPALGSPRLSTQGPTSQGPTSGFNPDCGIHPFADLGSAYWRTHIRNDGLFSSGFEKIIRFTAIEKSAPAPAVKPAVTASASSARLWEIIDHDPLGIVGDRFSARVAGSSDLVVDGVDVTPLISRSQLGMAHYFLVPGSTVQFRTTVAEFTAENNRTPGGQGAVLSHQGGARWHGEFFGIPRINLLVANVGLQSGKLKFQSNNYGGSLGGPLRNGGPYLFVDYAGLRQAIGRYLTGYVPTPALAASIAAVAPGLAPLLAAYPAGTKPQNGSTDALIFEGIGNQIDSEDALTVRLDEDFRGGARVRGRDALFVRANLDGAMIEAPYSGGDGYLNDQIVRHTRPVAGVLGWAHSFTPRLGQEFRLGYVRGTLETANQGVLGIPYSIVVSGLTTLAGKQTSYGASNAYSAENGVSWISAGKTLLAGASVRRLDLSLRNSDSGRVDFSSLAGFAANQPSWAVYSQALPANTLTEWQASGWVQEDWKPRPNLLIGGGVRYEFFNRLHELENKAIPFDFATCGEQGFCPAGTTFNRIDPVDLDPRLSFAWGPDRGPDWLRSHVVLRAGGGIYHANGLLSEQSQPVYNEVKNFSLSASRQPGLSYPITPFLDADPAGIASARGMSRQRPDPYAGEWSVSLETQLPRQLMAAVSYFGAQGTHLPSSTYLNLIDPATLTRPHAQFGQIRYLNNSGSSSVHALALFLTRDLRNGMQMSAGYNWAHEIDDGAAGDIGADAPENPACMRCERASGDQDVRNTAGLRTLYPLPLGVDRASHFQNKMLNHVAGDWDLLSSFSGRSALPVNVTLDRLSSAVATGYTVRQRPDRVWGTSIRPASAPSVHEWLNPAAFASVEGLYGTTPRNVARGPDQWRVDSGLRRQFLLPRRVRLSMRADVQNVFNHAQYAQPLSDWSTAEFGQIINPSNPGRVGAGGARAMFISFDASY